MKTLCKTALHVLPISIASMTVIWLHSNDHNFARTSYLCRNRVFKMNRSANVLNIQFSSDDDTLENGSDKSEAGCEAAAGDKTLQQYIEFYKNIIKAKDSKIKEMEGKLAELEIKEIVKDDLIKSLKLCVDLSKKMFVNNDEFLSFKDEMIGSIASIKNLIEQQSESAPKMNVLSESKQATTPDVTKKLNINEVENVSSIIDTNAVEPKQNVKDLVKDRNENDTNVKKIATYIPFGQTTEVKIMFTPNIKPFIPLFEENIAGPGWIVAMSRKHVNVNLERNYEPWLYGFGDKNTDYWLGLAKLHSMTSNRQHELYIHLVDYSNESRYARYDNFIVDNSDQEYALKSLGEYTGNAGDALRWHELGRFQNSHTFKTWWWHPSNGTSDCNLTGVGNRENVNSKTGVWWGSWNNDYHPIQSFLMLVRPK